MADKKPKYEKLDGDIVDYLKDLIKENGIENYQVDFTFLADNKMKKYIKIQKLPQNYQYITGKDVVVYINPFYHDKIQDDIDRKILVDQELNKIHVDLDTGKIKMNKEDVVTFSGIIKKFGADKVIRVNKLVDLIDDGHDPDEFKENDMQNPADEL